MLFKDMGYKGRGYTLLELMAVMAIIFITSALVVPFLRGFSENGKLKAAVRAFVSTLNYARGQAISSGLKHRVYIDTSLNGYWVAVEEDPQESPGEYTPLEGRMGVPKEFPRGIIVSAMGTPRGENASTQDYIEFSPKGTGEEAWVHITNGDKVYTVSVSPSTGRAKLLEGELVPQHKIEASEATLGEI
jgi:prepilin-type N-terminal cleavage/methylation domain-containing protein